MSRRATSELRDISLEYNFTELSAATINWHVSKRLGSGSFGAVFRGELPDGSEVAIKVIDLGALGAAGQAPEMAGFEEEVMTLSKFRHPNLVTLLGWGKHEQNRYLIYELLSGGDAFQRVQKSKNGQQQFFWHERLSCLLDAATGLSHMHNSKPKAFHRDIKAANILLDRHGTAKMADFGLSCTSRMAGDLHVTVKTISGTPGYACPIYSRTGRVTEGSEVYSFGMVMLELITSLAPAAADPRRPGGITFPIQTFVAPNQPGAMDRCLQQLDPTAGWPPQLATEIGTLALRCVTANDEKQRPFFVELVRTLRKMTENYPAKPAVQPHMAVPAFAMPPPIVPQVQGGTSNNEQDGSYASGHPAVCASGQPAPAAGAPHWPAPPALALEFVRCEGVPSAESIPLESRRLNLVPGAPGSDGLRVAPFGRQHQPEIFDAWLPDPGLRYRVSRTAFELCWKPGVKEAFLRPCGTSPLIVDGKTSDRNGSMPVRVGSEIAFLGGGSGSDSGVFLVLRLVAGREDLGKPSAPAQAQVAVPVAHGHQSGVTKWRLVCSLAEGMSEDMLKDLPADKRCVALTEGITLLGRQHQPAVFECLLANSTKNMSLISRTHVQLQAGEGLTLTNMSSNPIAVNGELVSKGQTRTVSADHVIGFLRPEGSSKLEFLGMQVIELHLDRKRLSSSGAASPVSEKPSEKRLSSSGAASPALEKPSEARASFMSTPPRSSNPDIGVGVSGGSLSFAPSSRAEAAGCPDPTNSPGKFMLELGGAGVLDVPRSQRIIDLVDLQDNAIIVGRKHQLELHRRAMKKECLEFVSREHFRVEIKSGKYFLKVLTSNPLWLARDGQRPSEMNKGEETVLLPNDSIIIDTEDREPYEADLSGKLLYWRFKQEGGY